MQRLAATITVLLIMTLTTFNTGAAALGINCLGKAECAGKGPAMVILRDAIDRDVDTFRQYYNGEQIACTDTKTCAFVQKFEGGSVFGAQLRTLMQDLVNHGCAICGSVPLDYPNSDDVYRGELTLDYVSNVCFRRPQSFECA